MKKSKYEKKICMRIIPIYHGDRPAATRGDWHTSKDYTFACVCSQDDPQKDSRRYGKTIFELCNGCKRYNEFQRLEKIYTEAARRISGKIKNGIEKFYN